MKGYLFKFLILSIGIFYLLAFLEVRIGDYGQTYGDEYDTYIVEDVGEKIAVEISKSLTFTPNLQVWLALTFLDFFRTNKHLIGLILFSSPPQKLHLRYSVFII